MSETQEIPVLREQPEWVQLIPPSPLACAALEADGYVRCMTGTSKKQLAFNSPYTVEIYAVECGDAQSDVITGISEQRQIAKVQLDAWAEMPDWCKALGGSIMDNKEAYIRQEYLRQATA